MVVRYPHTAIVSVPATTVTDGKFASESNTTTEISGRFEPSEGISRVQDPDGEYTAIKARFFTKSEQITGAEKLTFNGETFRIHRWHQYQTHSEIWLA